MSPERGNFIDTEIQETHYLGYSREMLRYGRGFLPEPTPDYLHALSEKTTLRDVLNNLSPEGARRLIRAVRGAGASLALASREYAHSINDGSRSRSERIAGSVAPATLIATSLLAVAEAQPAHAMEYDIHNGYDAEATVFYQDVPPLAGAPELVFPDDLAQAFNGPIDSDRELPDNDTLNQDGVITIEEGLIDDDDKPTPTPSSTPTPRAGGHIGGSGSEPISPPSSNGTRRPSVELTPLPTQHSSRVLEPSAPQPTQTGRDEPSPTATKTIEPTPSVTPPEPEPSATPTVDPEVTPTATPLPMANVENLSSYLIFDASQPFDGQPGSEPTGPIHISAEGVDVGAEPLGEESILVGTAFEANEAYFTGVSIDLEATELTEPQAGSVNADEDKDPLIQMGGEQGLAVQSDWTAVRYDEENELWKFGPEYPGLEANICGPDDEVAELKGRRATYTLLTRVVPGIPYDDIPDARHRIDQLTVKTAEGECTTSVLLTEKVFPDLALDPEEVNNRHILLRLPPNRKGLDIHGIRLVSEREILPLIETHPGLEDLNNLAYELGNASVAIDLEARVLEDPTLLRMLQEGYFNGVHLEVNRSAYAHNTMRLGMIDLLLASAMQNGWGSIDIPSLINSGGPTNNVISSRAYNYSPEAYAAVDYWVKNAYPTLRQRWQQSKYPNLSIAVVANPAGREAPWGGVRRSYIKDYIEGHYRTKQRSHIETALGTAWRLHNSSGEPLTFQQEGMILDDSTTSVLPLMSNGRKIVDIELALSLARENTRLILPVEELPNGALAADMLARMTENLQFFSDKGFASIDIPAFPDGHYNTREAPEDFPPFIIALLALAAQNPQIEIALPGKVSNTPDLADFYANQRFSEDVQRLLQDSEAQNRR